MLELDERGRAVAARFTDRYAFEGFLGHGGFAAVYRVRNLRLDRVEALKVLLEARGGEPEFTARFEREARVAASLEHPNVIRVYDFGNADGTLWYSMQYVDGPTLRVQLERHGRMRGEEAAGLLVPLLEALEVVHRGGIVHRDVKPDNIILDGDGRPYLMDFGILKSDDNVHETADGKILGTPGFLSPEQLRGNSLDGRSDLYAVGVTLYQMLTGDIPFRSADRIATMTRRLTEDPEPPSAKTRDLEPELERIVLKALARERENRYATAAEMRVDLEAFLAASGAPRRSHSGAMLRALPVPGSPPAARAADDPGAGTSILSPPAASAGTQAPASAARPARGSIWLAASAVLVLGALAFAALVRDRRPQTGLELTVPDARASGAASPSPSPASSVPPAASPSPASAPAARPTKPAPIAERVSLPDAAPRVPRVRADVEEEATVIVPPSLASLCGGKTVGITVVVAADGSLKSSRVISSAGSACDDVALDAVSRYRFRAERDEHDRPVEGRLTISVRY